MIGRWNRSLVVAIVLSGASGNPLAAQQAEEANAASDAEQAGLADIVVTAQRRSESSQQIPLSIVALGQETLEKRSIFDINDLQTSVPTVQITPFPTGATSSRVFIRGVGSTDDQITADPSVAIYYDGVYVARSQGLGAEVAEVERIEVLRGPQGSLYGRNATGGAINYILRPPQLGAFEAKQTLMFGNYDQFRSRTNINVPIGDRFAIAAGYLHAEKDGYVRNQGGGVRRFGDQNRDAYRIAARWQPFDALDLRYAYDRTEVGDTPIFAPAVPAYPRIVERPEAGSPYVTNLLPNDTVAQGHSLIAAWDFSETLTVKSISAYRKLSAFNNQSLLAGAFGPFPTIETTYQLDQDQFTQEVQILGKALDAQVEYILGGYYFDEEAHSSDSIRIIGLPQTGRQVRIANKAYAIFGQATYRPSWFEGIYVTGGLRWSRDERRAEREGYSQVIGQLPVADPPGAGNRKFSNLAPSLVLGYNGPNGLNLYAKYSRGYKTGGFNLRASSVTAFNRGFGEETLDSYELGVKSSWLDNRLRVNLALFRSLYKDIQTSVPIDLNNVAISDVFNAGRARIQGAELELVMRPARDLTVSATYSYLDAKYTRIVDGSGNDITNRYVFINAPKHTLSITTDWTIAKTPIGELSALADYYLQDKKYSQANLPAYRIRGYGLLSGRLSLTDIPVGIGKNWKLSAFGKNLTNSVYYLDYFPTVQGTAILGEPRTYGLELSVEY